MSTDVKFEGTTPNAAIAILKSVKRAFLSAGAIGIVLGASVLPVCATDTVLIQRDDFDVNGTLDGAFDSDWIVTKTAGATVTTGGPHSALYLGTTPDESGPGTAVVAGKLRFRVSDNIVFKARVRGAYVEAGSVYGNRQPRGLVAGTSRKNAIEFITASPTNFVSCRTVKDGVVTHTNVNIGHTVYAPTIYQIIARPTQVDFYIDGKLVATHTTNIPTVGLNLYFATSDSGAGNVPLIVDWVSFERLAN